ncbi:MAG: hypothetical protein QM533_11655 [Cytophagales bacterium]|nr:hypothetical protein [Cytophagales bacterium]
MQHCKFLIGTLIAVAFAASLTGCASPSYYQAAGEGGKYFGYADRQVDGALYRINFVASPVANFDQTYAFALYRAAELAQSKGATHFEVLEGSVNRDAIERFIGRATALSQVFDSKDLTDISRPYLESPMIQPVRYMRTQTYIYVPVQPPPPPLQISLLIRLLNAPSLDASKGFDVQDLLTRLGPKIVRPPVKAA